MGKRRWPTWQVHIINKKNIFLLKNVNKNISIPKCYFNLHFFSHHIFLHSNKYYGPNPNIKSRCQSKCLIDGGQLQGNRKNWRTLILEQTHSIIFFFYLREIKYEHIVMVLKLITKIDQTQKIQKNEFNSFNVTKVALIPIVKLFYQIKSIY